MTTETHDVETRICMNCGAANLRCPPEMTHCRFCRVGLLETPKAVWE